MTSPTDEHEPPPPPAPAPHVAGAVGGVDVHEGGSNSTTPRGSMENLPPPPPDLLHSDDDIGDRPLSNASNKDHQELISKRSLSVAESVKVLQQRGHTPCSPRGLRRAHSIAATTGHPQQRPGQAGMFPKPKQEQIYAPVAHLQQKIQQRQINNIHPASQQQIQPQQQLQAQQLQAQQLQPQQLQAQQSSPEAEQYGFGIQFQQHQSQFLQQQSHQFANQQPQLSQQQFQHPQLHQQQAQIQQHHYQQQATSPTANAMMQEFQSLSMHDPQNQSYGVAAHDQIMRDIDAKLRQRPQPPPMQNNFNTPGGYDAQTALRVRRWIESKTVTDVRETRPLLNAEIHQGFALRKTQNTNDRSAPRF